MVFLSRQTGQLKKHCSVAGEQNFSKKIRFPRCIQNTRQMFVKRLFKSLGCVRHRLLKIEGLGTPLCHMLFPVQTKRHMIKDLDQTTKIKPKPVGERFINQTKIYHMKHLSITKDFLNCFDVCREPRAKTIVPL